MRARLSQLGLNALLSGLAFLTLFPFLMMLLIAGKDRAQLQTRFWGLPSPVRWDNFGRAAELVAPFVVNSIIVSAAVTVLALLVASLAAYAFTRIPFRGRGAAWSLVIGLLLVPGVLVLVPLFLRVRELGLFNSHTGIILPQVAGSLPFAIFLFRNFFDQLPEALFGSAEIDGANDWQVLLHVVLPLSKPIVSTVGVLVLLSSWNNYVWPLVVTRDEALRTIPLGLVFLYTDLNLSNFPNPGLEMAAYAMGAAPIVVIFFLATRTFLQGITSGAIKD